MSGRPVNKKIRLPPKLVYIDPICKTCRKIISIVKSDYVVTNKKGHRYTTNSYCSLLCACKDPEFMKLLEEANKKWKSL